MDMQKIGSFLSLLRKEHGLTQEQLGQKLGVTNKTVSRWETGTYLPPVEMLQLLSELYGITINEILSAERLEEKQYREKAEENIISVLSKSTFTLNEKIEYFKKKWNKEHLFGLIVEGIVVLALLVTALWLDKSILVSLIYAGLLWRIGYHRNSRQTYIEERAFDGSGNR